MHYSQTQASNIASVVGLLVLILPRFGLDIGSEELTQFLGASVTIVGIIWNWYHRYQKGDITMGGFKK